MDSQAGQAKKRILVVEDEKPLRDLYVQLLVDEGYDVDQATDGEEAIVSMQQGGYDLILLDIVLPKMDGVTILKKLRESGAAKSNRAIVVLSNLGQDDVIATAISLGARGYMIKSDYTPDQVIKQVNYYLDGQ